MLEVLTPGAVPSKQPLHEKTARKTKIKLLDRLQDSLGAQMPPEEFGKRLKIRLLDTAPELAEAGTSSEPAARASRIRLHASAATREDAGLIERKVAPLDSPRM